MKTLFFSVLGLFALVFLVFFFNSVDLASFKFFAPKYENARREVFENTQSYVEGKRQEVSKYRLEYLRAKDPAEKNAIRMTILQSTANLDLSKLPPDLEMFVRQLGTP